MNLIDERMEVAGVAKRWRAQYCRDGKWSTIFREKSSQAVYDALARLDDKTATRAEVAAITGNTSWAGPYACNECDETVERCVEIGRPPDYDSSTAYICENCIRKALALFNSTPAKGTDGL